MSTAAEASPTPSVAAQHAPSMPAVLNREPSQQDLEIARHLQSFQSQGVPHQEPSENGHGPQQHESEIQNDYPYGGEPRHDENAAPQPLGQPQQSLEAPAIQFTPLQQQQQQQPTSAPSATGQMCSNCGTTKTPLWRRSPTGAVICNACGLYYKARNQMRPAGVKRGAAAASYNQPGPQQNRGTSPNSIQGGATYVPADRSVNGTCPGGGRCNGTGGHEGCNGCPAYNNRISKTAQVALRQASNGGGEPIQPSNQNPGQAQQSVTIACQNCGTTITPLWRRDEAGNTICNACGLYYKLHNQHRPVGMKKAEIKRRKRIVPSGLAGDDYTSDVADEDRLSLPPRTEPSTSPRPQHIHTMTDVEPTPKIAGGPIPVDFTDMFRSRKPPSDTASQSSVPRKRSFSATASDPMEPYPHAQNMALTQENIDPNLPVQNDPVQSQQRNSDGRRAELQAEAQKMRRLLLEKEREIAALGEEG